MKKSVKRLLNYKFHVRGIMNPFLNMQINSMLSIILLSLSKKLLPIRLRLMWRINLSEMKTVAFYSDRVDMGH